MARGETRRGDPKLVAVTIGSPKRSSKVVLGLGMRDSGRSFTPTEWSRGGAQPSRQRVTMHANAARATSGRGRSRRVAGERGKLIFCGRRLEAAGGASRGSCSQGFGVRCGRFASASYRSLRCSEKRGGGAGRTSEHRRDWKDPEGVGWGAAGCNRGRWAGTVPVPEGHQRKLAGGKNAPAATAPGKRAELLRAPAGHRRNGPETLPRGGGAVVGVLIIRCCGGTARVDQTVRVKRPGKFLRCPAGARRIQRCNRGCVRSRGLAPG